MPEVSILIPYYNDEDFLADSIHSVLNQSYTDFELILLNHACTDSSRKIAHCFDDTRIVHIDLPTNAGAGGGVILSAFLKAARGKFLKLFCADDLLHYDYLEKCMECFEEHPDKDILFTDMRFVNNKGEYDGCRWFQYKNFNIHIKDENDILKEYFHGNSVLPLPASIFRRKLTEDLEIDMTLIMKFDVLLWMRLISNGGKVRLIDDCYVDYRIHTGQTSSSVNMSRSYTQSCFELPIILDEFFKIMNLDLFEHLVDNWFKYDLQNMVDEKNADFIARFLFAKFIIGINNFQYQGSGYRYLHGLFQDSESRKKLHDLGFSIYDFRKLYSKINIRENSDLLSYFFTWGHENLNGLGIKGLSKEVMRRIPKKLFNHKKEKLVPL